MPSTAADDTALVIVAFNRPRSLARVLDVVAANWDGPVFAQIDAPRDGHRDDVAATDACRQEIQRRLGPAGVELWSPDRNLGVALGVPTAVDHAFRTHDRLMILEDDCLPHPDFFSFMPAMLGRFAEDERVMHVNANTYGEQFDTRESGSCTFGHLAQAWGWATWRRAWVHYEQVISDDAHVRQQVIHRLPLTPQHRRVLARRWAVAASPDNRIAWDFQWQYTVARAGGLVAVPKRNLISNVGFGPGASNTHNSSDYRSGIPSAGMPAPYRAPEAVEAVPAVTQRYARHMLGPASSTHALLRRAGHKLKSLVSRSSRSSASQARAEQA